MNDAGEGHSRRRRKRCIVNAPRTFQEKGPHRDKSLKSRSAGTEGAIPFHLEDYIDHAMKRIESLRFQYRGDDMLYCRLFLFAQDPFDSEERKVME